MRCVNHILSYGIRHGLQLRSNRDNFDNARIATAGMQRGSSALHSCVHEVLDDKLSFANVYMGTWEQHHQCWAGIGVGPVWRHKFVGMDDTANTCFVPGDICFVSRDKLVVIDDTCFVTANTFFVIGVI